MTVDFRMEWMKQKTLKMLGLKNDGYFNTMLSNTKDLEETLLSFFDDDFLQDEDRQLFCVYKTPQQKLIEQETVVPRQGKCIDISYLNNLFDVHFITTSGILHGKCLERQAVFYKIVHIRISTLR